MRSERWWLQWKPVAPCRRWNCKWIRGNLRELQCGYARSHIYAGRNSSLSPHALGMGKTLWRYFNAPGNVMFVTTNIVTLAGIICYSTLTSIGRENSMNMCDLEPQDGLVAESPLKRYSEGEIRLGDNKSPASSIAQHVKMSLCHLFYSYYMCRDVANGRHGDDVEDVSEWMKEVRAIQNEIPTISDKMNVPPATFYHVWKQEFVALLGNLNRSQQFHMPDWRQYPKDLQAVCFLIYHSDLRTLGDFIKVYNDVPYRSLRTLLRAWLYDNSHLFKVTNDIDNEQFYSRLLRASVPDSPLFSKYASIILDPSNPRRRVFFNNRLREGTPTAALGTIVEVLNGLKGNAQDAFCTTARNDAVIRLISMIRADCIMARNKRGRNEVRILLFQGSVDEIQQKRASSDERKACYRLVSEDARVMRVLNSLSELKNE
ncbi:LAMI_0A01244g1_1 [Lachancea mirantina]|uniref:LAMI_0A01244g1_1 n=1 Tax=Lachancea mirantina TaxID=1230905 RepID=A0A1G4ILJ7_9SACH|nr:LAMI_0A01244g1_1 [Lachancea mirantina]